MTESEVRIIKPTEQLEKQADFQSSIFFYWRTIMESINVGDMIKFYNLVIYGLEPHVGTITDERFERNKSMLEDKRKRAIDQYMDGGEIIITETQRDKVNIDYAKEIYAELQALFKRSNLLGIFSSQSDIDLDEIPKGLINDVHKRILKNNGNWMCVVTGDTGSGKSYSAMSIAEKIDPNFDSSNVVFNAVDCLKKINDCKDKKGSVILFDEAGVGVGSREWFSTLNKQFAYVMETFRLYNLALIFTLPSFFDLDKKLRGFVHSRIETIGIYNKQSHVKWKNIKRTKDELRFLYPITSVGGIMYKVKDIAINKPSQELLKDYEAKKKRYADSVLKNAISEITPLNPFDDNNEKLSLEEMKLKILTNPEDYQGDHGTITEEMLKFKFGLGSGTARKLKEAVKYEQKKLLT